MLTIPAPTGYTFDNGVPADTVCLFGAGAVAAGLSGDEATGCFCPRRIGEWLFSAAAAYVFIR